MSSSPHKTTIQNRHARLAHGNRSLRQLFAVSLILGVLAVLQTVRADFVLLNNSFNNSTNNIAVNDLGIGGGFSAYSTSNGVNTYYNGAFETNGYAEVATSVLGNLSSSIASFDTFNLNGGGTLFEFAGVNFSTNTPGPNTGIGSNDRLMVGVSDQGTAGEWFANAVAGLPNGFWIQLNSDSIVTGTGSGAWSGTSTLFYKGRSGTVTQLTSWVFDNLKWSPSNPTVTNRTLDIKLTITGTGWALNITGDTVGGVALNRTGTFATAAIKNELADGLTSTTYVNAYNQTERPGIAMTIDQVIVSQVGNLSITTPTFSTPDESGNTNGVLAGETTILTSIVTATGSPTLQWQMEDSSNPGTFTNIPSATATNVSINTTNLGDSTPRGVRLIGTLSGNSVTSSVVTLTVFPASAPVIVQDIDPAGAFALYNGAGATISTSFAGNKPIYYQWLHSGPNNVFTNLPGETNNTYTIVSASSIDAGSYYVVATNALGTTLSSQTFLQITPGTPLILWNSAFKYGGLTADQILASFPSTNKLAGAMVAQNGGSPIVVTNTGGAQIAFAPNNSWASVAHFNGYGTGANTNKTGNANFNKVLDTFVYDNTYHTITLNGLAVGSNYQVQLFGLDDRTGNTKRGQNWQNPQDSQDISLTYAMGANAYMIGTFTATATSQVIQQNVPTNNLGNFNAVVLRTVGWTPAPYFTLQPKSLGYFTGDNASITGAAAGDTTIASPTISYQWKSGPVGGPYTSLTEGSKFNGTTTTTLTITNLALVDDSVVYVLAASNGGGTQNSAEVHLGVQQTPSAPTPGSYAALALSYGPTALWMLNETLDPSLGNVKAYDYSGNNYRAQYGTTAKDGFNTITGPQPTAFPGFDANQAALQPTANDANSVVVIPSLNHTNIATTIVMWINPTDNGNFAKGLFYNRNAALPGQIGGLGYNNGNGTLGYNWNDVGATYNYNSGLSPKQNQWNMVALVIETNQATFYLDYVDSVTTANVLLQAVNPAPNASVLTFAGGNTYIGLDSYAASRTFGGRIAGVSLYNKALTQSQILALFGAGVGVSGGFPPSIATQPTATKLAYPGQTVKFTAGGVGGTVPITYQWQSNNVNLVEGGQFSGTQTNVLTITGVTTGNAATYHLVLQNSVGTTTSSNSVLTIVTPPTPHLIGHWLSGAQSYTDSSGFTPAGTHDGGIVGTGTYYFTNDVPGGYTGNSLYFGGTSQLVISNTVSTDPGYLNTFDNTNTTLSRITVAFWAKGFPGTWNPWVSKNGEVSGWQLRRQSGGNSTFTLRGTSSGNPDPTGPINSNDGQWHYYAGTFDNITGARVLYVDGKLQLTVNPDAGNITSAANSYLVIGGRSNTGTTYASQFTGWIYDVRIYDAAVPLSQLAIIGGSTPTLTKTQTGPNQLVLSWPFGTLLESTNLLGPWTTNSQGSPLTNTVFPDAQHYYRVRNP